MELEQIDFAIQFYSTTFNFVAILLDADNNRNLLVVPRMPTKRLKGTSSSVTSEQKSNDLEFVTILNPNEIKDPVKQKAIRQHARRRENHSKSRSRQPFKLVFNLPSRTEPVQSITSSYDMLSAAGGYLKLTHFVPSLQFLRPVTTVRGQSFPMPHSPDIDVRVMQLIDFGKNVPDSFPLPHRRLSFFKYHFGKTLC
jgi:hypothetical protein